MFVKSCITLTPGVNVKKLFSFVTDGEANKLDSSPLETFPVRPLNLRARPKPTQSEDISDASFLGKLRALPANVRLDWKVITRYNTLAYSASSSPTKKKSFITLAPLANVIKLFCL
jgi:hypothetical protein